MLHTQPKGRRLNVLENMEIYKQKTFDGRIINEQVNTASDIIFEPLEYCYRKQSNKLITTANITGQDQSEKDHQKRTITDFYKQVEKDTTNIRPSCHK